MPQNVSSYNTTLENLLSLSQNATCTFEYSEEPTNYTVVNLATVVVVCFYILRVIYEGLKIYSNFVFSSIYKTIDSELQWLLVYVQEQNDQKLTDAFEQSAPSILKKVLSKSIYYKNIFKEMLTEFASINRLGKELVK